MQNHAKILWTTDNKETALNMICLYAHNAKTPRVDRKCNYT